MSSLARVRSEFVASWHSFLRRRTAVFFTFFFPAIIVVIFGALVQTQPTGGGLFAEPKEYYIAGYLAVVVLFTPLSRVGSTIARHREGNRFEKLATTPLSRAEWLLAHSLVNVVVIGLAALLLLGLSVLVTGASIPLSAPTLAVVPFVALGVTLFCGLGAIIGSVADSQDGVIAASNAIALPLLFLSETFVTPDLLPTWFVPALNLSPLTFFARGVRALTYTGGDWAMNLAILAGLSVVFFVAGTLAIPQTD
ncbi:ABC transporter permease [Haloferax mediterranei ATCC 33500]|uniref:ABC transporter permease n=1 Tax=Haloferax mediterranei (strain ATCC 33500 / DSM 1411 / JCM 8866 / NBRC 14739 / NCIMB 2177 / R-4) TaxID=523841 RepID=I3R3A9_HALMT|nr:ABC transporter permease [Haloferax mediterranei]AFK18719.1 ABC-type transport system permease protein [Haloferax mediterranei ATCC 33500]AHZ21913.1 ABC transporter permease [Haloferax mediterranei ATCC 33500]EMA03421.1 ABC-type transport system permease [Haloferax mediterranei ATCC 33500]MDX5988815.1 ABC transporter permease [Haloferax mediterranei ATCC 33500]QCQ75218.1 ABC transporter permease [Haloferax mediterranei ATCC 33500]